MAKTVTTTKIERTRQNSEMLKKELELVDAMIENILSGRPISYGIGSRNVSRYPINLTELFNVRDRIETKIEELEDVLEGSTKRRAISVVPMDW